jgi:complement component 1 Q subcomponent-binding protein, mitochondrial
VEEEKGNCIEGEDLEELHDKINKIFELEETAGNMEVSLVGEVKGDSIRIKFDAQGTVDVEEEYDGEDDDEETDESEPVDYDAEGDEDEEEEDELPGIRFVAEITRDNAGLQFECVASSNLTIERVRFLTDFAKDVDTENFYYGPNFIDLELDLQESLYKYLAERHIDDELASFITQYSDLKEQREYLSFLENTLKFVKK